ncbi:hypothetical protein B0I35DRAFT_123235 [Stachybotrys elegans]|uniref:Clock-controlled protein 6 n=1 Tax=Stachybotrys elegans TaxID=80388 RepID=A0A8K0WWL0_9HYPO|nr:hypothetical protein B0I35DRAFT_123235 [Stachybotrys elegans]
MKYAVAAAALASGVAAFAANNVTVVTEVVEVYTTYCPGPTEITYGSSTYTITEATTLTITDCPCTVTKPVTTSAIEVCHTCTETPVIPSPPPLALDTTAPSSPCPALAFPLLPPPRAPLPPSTSPPVLARPSPSLAPLLLVLSVLLPSSCKWTNISRLAIHV